MTEPVTELGLSGYLDIAQRRKRMVLTIAILILELAVAAAALQTPLYRAESLVSVGNVALATGILVGLGAALLLDSLDDTVVSKQELERP